MWVLSHLEHAMMPLQWGVVIGTSLLAAASDLRTRRIPNLLTGTVFFTGLTFALLTGGWGQLADGALGAMAMGLPFVVLFLLAGGGAGDAKLMGALGTWLGLAYGTIVLVTVALSGAALAVVYALAKRRAGTVARNLVQIASSVMVVGFGGSRLKDLPELIPSKDQMETVPYGLAIFVGVIVGAGAIGLWQF